MKLKNKKESYIIGILLILFGLTPLLWYRAPGFIISGDMLPPLTWEQFCNKFFSWDERMGAGCEALLHFSALFFYFLEAVFTTLFQNLVVAQKAEFIFWFLMPGLSIYYFLGVILQGEGKRWGRLVGTVFYMMNLYLEPVWQGMNIANLSAYVFIPLMLGLMIEGLERRRSFWFCVLSISILSFFAAPICSNPPMLLASLLPFLFTLIFFLVRDKIWKHPRQLLWLGGFFGTILFFSLLVNLFWIIPFVDKVFVNVASTSLEFTPASAMDWLRGLCKNTSLLNVARMQGAWVWYAGFGGEPYAPYAFVYQNNFFFILLGYLLPVLVAVGFYLSRKNPTAILLGFFSVSGIILGAGIHPPFGKFYEWLLHHVPFFYVVRSPWYKFTLLTCIGYAGLLALLAQNWGARLNKKAFLPAVGIFLLMAFQLVYAFPVILGKLFFTPVEREMLTHNFMAIPDYVKDCLKHLHAKKGFFRVFDASPKKMQQYNWGNYGFNHPLTSFTSSPVFYGSMMKSPSLYPSDEIEKMLIKTVQSRLSQQFVRLLNLFNIEYVIFPADLYWYSMDEINENAAVRKFLEETPGLVFEKKFGPWNLYKVDQRQRPLLQVEKEADVVIGGLSVLPYLPYMGKGRMENYVTIDPGEPDFLKSLQTDQTITLLNQGIQDLAASYWYRRFKILKTTDTKEVVTFVVSEENSYEIWVEISSFDLNRPPTLFLDDIYLPLSQPAIVPGPVPQWVLAYSGKLTRGIHSLYVRNRDDLSEIKRAALIPESKLKEGTHRLFQEIKDKRLGFKNCFFAATRNAADSFKKYFYVSHEGEYEFELHYPSVKKDEKHVLWSFDLPPQDAAKVEYIGNPNDYTQFNQEYGVVLNFLTERSNEKPSVEVSFKLLKPVSLAEYPNFYLDYKIMDPRSCSTDIHFDLDVDGDGKKDQELFFATSPYVALGQEAMRHHLNGKTASLVGVRLILRHTFVQRKWIRNYPAEDLILRKLSVGRQVLAESSPIALSLDGKKLAYWEGESKVVHLSEGEHVLEGEFPADLNSISFQFLPAGEHSREQSDIPWKKSSPASYTVQIKEPFKGIVVLNQAYHPRWIARIKKGERLPHVKVNGWANGFCVNSSTAGHLQIYFENQKFIKLGYLLSGLALLVFAGSWLGIFRRRRKRL